MKIWYEVPPYIFMYDVHTVLEMYSFLSEILGWGEIYVVSVSHKAYLKGWGL